MSFISLLRHSHSLAIAVMMKATIFASHLSHGVELTAEKPYKISKKIGATSCHTWQSRYPNGTPH